MNLSPAEIYSLVSIKQNDSARVLYDDLIINGTAINLSGSSVALVWHDPCTRVTTRKVATVAVEASGSVLYQLTAEYVGTAGSFICEWEITFGDGKKLTVPTDGYLKLNIEDDLDA